MSSCDCCESSSTHSERNDTCPVCVQLIIVMLLSVVTNTHTYTNCTGAIQTDRRQHVHVCHASSVHTLTHLRVIIICENNNHCFPSSSSLRLASNCCNNCPTNNGRTSKCTAFSSATIRISLSYCLLARMFSVCTCVQMFAHVSSTSDRQ